MTDHSKRYATVCAGFTERLQGVEGQWDAPTPCTEWNVRQLVSHVIDVHRRVLARLDGGDAPEVGESEDLPPAWKDVSSRIQAALEDPKRASTEVESFGSRAPFEQVVGTLLVSDTVAHTWDLARATGQDETLDPDAVRSTREFITPFGDMMRSPGGFGPELEAPADADEQTKLLAFMGRKA